MKAALERGDDINARDIGGATALSEAAGTPNDRVEVIAFLLARGASVNARNDAGETALECACTAGNLKVENPQASES